MKIIYSFIFFLSISTSFFAQSSIDSLKSILKEIESKNVLPGFALSIIKDGQVRFSEGYGFADIKKKIVYAPQSVQNIGSISKTFIGVSLMKLVELGKISLDDPINKYLPYTIFNPRFPDIPITIRHLASHTGGLDDPFDYERAYIFDSEININNPDLPKKYKKYVKLFNSNQKVSLDEFIQSIYIKGGKYYKKKNFSKKKPGEKYNYSNIGAAIAARVVELASGQSFEEFTRQHIFNPLNMKNSTWKLNDVSKSQKVTPYLTRTMPIPHYSLITFADGGLITSVEELGIYANEMMNCYLGKGSLLSEKSAKEMMTPYNKEGEDLYGIFWSISKSGKGIGHNGADPGTFTNMYFYPEKGIVKIIFTNLPPYEKETIEAVRDAWNAMQKVEDKL